MAGALDAGTLSGRVEITDAGSPALNKFGDSADKAANRSSSFSKEVQETETAMSHLGDRIERVGERVAEYFAIREVAHFIEGLGSASHELEVLSKETEIGVEDLQVLGGATAEYGIDSDALGRQIFQLSRRIAGGDQSAATALHSLGLSFDDLQGLSPEETFLKITRALGSVTGPAKDLAASELFGGRLGKAVLALSTDVDGAMDHVRNSVHITSAQSVKELSDLDVSLSLMQKNLHALAAEAVGPLAAGFNVMVEGAQKSGGWWKVLKAAVQDYVASSIESGPATSHLAKVLVDAGVGQQALTDATKTGTSASKEHVEALTAEQTAARFISTLTRDAIKPLTEWQAKDLAQLKELNQLNEKNAAVLGVTSDQFKVYEEKAKAGAEAQKKFKEAMVELDSAGKSYRETINGINGDTVDAVKYYLQAGVSQNALKEAYGLTEVQIKAVAESLKEETKSQQMAEKQAEVLARAEEDLAQKRIDLYGTDLQKSNFASEKKYEEAVKKLQDEGDTAVDHYNRLWDIYNEDVVLNMEAEDKKKDHTLEIYDVLAKAEDEATQRHIEAYGTDLQKANYTSEKKYEEEVKRLQDLGDTDVAHYDELWALYEQDVEANRKATDKKKDQFKELKNTVKSISDELNIASDAVSLFGGKMDSTFKKVFDIGAKAVDLFIRLSSSLGSGGGGGDMGGGGGFNWGSLLTSAIGFGSLLAFDEGGVGDFGTGTLAMLHGKEAIVPLEKAGQMGGSVVNQFYINGTGAEVARQVEQVIMRRYKQTRQVSLS